MAAPTRLTRPAPAAPAFEAIEIRTADAWSLRAHVFEPHASEGRARGVAVLAHGIASDKRVFDWPSGAGFAHFLVARGWRVVAFDFRGHGESHALAGSGRCAYDHLIDRDLVASCDYARYRAGDSGRDGAPLPVVVVGHGLGGHAALAAVGTGAVDVDAVVALGTTVWIAELDPSRPRRWILGAGARIAARLRLASRLPVSEGARAIAGDLVRFTRSGRWESADGRRNYLASLGAIRVPVLDVVGDADVGCPPSSAERLVARCGGPHEVLRICQTDGGGGAPTARDLVNGARARAAWARVEAWIRAATERIHG
ncbi:MAG: lysophospholipase [Polyangiaceae bacterium]|nr:lysophospholipase [Polyangiaceae bacterium]